LFLSIFCEGENIFALYPAHMASGRLFIPGELKIFHGGTPVLGPPRGGPTTINGCVKNKNLNKKKYKIGNGAHKINKKKLTKK
ncbi:hypothetical protein ACVGXB_02335, partial [Enterobacter intestinihominis]